MRRWISTQVKYDAEKWQWKVATYFGVFSVVLWLFSRYTHSMFGLPHWFWGLASYGWFWGTSAMTLFALDLIIGLMIALITRISQHSGMVVSTKAMTTQSPREQGSE